ncbi:MAG: 30S ribosomal protein S15 [Proteobacteria bacterium]|nr:30S ribosomal protein S15 [Pseudomonadota bacterium]
MFCQIEKQNSLRDGQLHPSDTASPEAQITLITYRLKYLNHHFTQHPKDFHSRMGLLKLVGRRKRLLNYLKKKNFNNYKTLITKLGIRK